MVHILVKSGVFYLAQAEAKPAKDRAAKNQQILVSSPLVAKPVAVRYAWARSPMGNLKVDGIPWQPLHSLRTGQAANSLKARLASAATKPWGSAPAFLSEISLAMVFNWLPMHEPVDLRAESSHQSHASTASGNLRRVRHGGRRRARHHGR